LVSSKFHKSDENGKSMSLICLVTLSNNPVFRYGPARLTMYYMFLQSGELNMPSTVTFNILFCIS